MRAVERPAANTDFILDRRLVRAALPWVISQSELAGILGSSAASVSRTFAGDRPVDPASAEGRHALLFVRVFRSLDALVGGDAEKARLWLRSANRHLGAEPARLLARTQGLVHVAEYLDALRGTL